MAGLPRFHHQATARASAGPPCALGPRLRCAQAQVRGRLGLGLGGRGAAVVVKARPGDGPGEGAAAETKTEAGPAARTAPSAATDDDAATTASATTPNAAPGSAKKAGSRRRRRAPPPPPPPPEDAVEAEEEVPVPSTLLGMGGDQKVPDDVNPFELGRRARKATTTFWNTFLSLGSAFSSRSSGDFDIDVDMTRPTTTADGAPVCNVGTDSAETNTVLVVGATGTVGKIVVRKLVLRGYNVRCLVRPRESIPLQPSTTKGPDLRVGGRHGRTLRHDKGETPGPPLEAVCGDDEAKQLLGLPKPVEIVWGDISNGIDCYRAVDPCCVVDASSYNYRRYGWESLYYAPYDKPPTTKVVYCVGATDNPEDEEVRALCNVDGISNISDAYQKYWNGLTQMRERDFKRDRRIEVPEFNEKGKLTLFEFWDRTTNKGRGFNASFRDGSGKPRTDEPAKRRVSATLSRVRGVDNWRVVEPLTGKSAGSKPMSPQERLRQEYIEAFGVKNEAVVKKSDYKGVLRFEGEVYAKGGAAETRAALDQFQLPGDSTFADYEGLLLNCSCDGQPCYWLTLEDNRGNRYRTRMAALNAVNTWKKVRVPWGQFRPVNNKTPPLDVSQVKSIGIRYEAPTIAVAEKIRQKKALESRDFEEDDEDFVIPGPDDEEDEYGGWDEEEEEETLAARFYLDCSNISLLPKPDEPDFVLLSCTGAGAAQQIASRRGRLFGEPGYAMPEAESLLVEREVRRSKAAGEDRLKNTGLGYTIVRPGPLESDVPSGTQAMIFDQSGRVRGSIGAADVADVIVRTLHEGAAVNKSFEVCYEMKSSLPEGLEAYELVAHLSSLETDYLKPALEPLERNL